MSSSSLRQPRFQLRTFPLVCATFIALASAGYLPQGTIAQTGTRSQSEAGDLQCISYCSTLRPGKVIIELKLRLSDHPLDNASLLSALKQQRLEVTVYNEGFERGLYATVSPIKPNALFLVPTGANRARSATQAQTKIPGVQKLVITDVATRLDQQTNSFILMQTDLAPRSSATADSEWVNVRLEGAEPGVAYTFRSSGGRSVVTCHAASCPFDELPTQKNRATRKPETKR